MILINISSGECVSITERDDYNMDCTNGQCANGLQCFQNKCIICEHNSDLSFDGRKVNGDILQKGVCAKNSWSASPWDMRRADATILAYQRVIFTILSCFLYKSRLFPIIFGFIFAKIQHTRMYTKVVTYVKNIKNK
jgi:hypothetical protein